MFFSSTKNLHVPPGSSYSEYITIILWCRFEEATLVQFLADARPGSLSVRVAHAARQKNPPGTMLTREELVAFKRDGVVIVRNLIPQHQIAEWRKQCWEPLAIGPGDPLPQGGAGSRNSFLFTEDHAPRLRYPYPDLTQVADPRPLCPAVGEQPEMKAVLDQLLGPNTWAPGIAAPPDADAGIEMDVVAFRWPVDEEIRAEGVDPTSTWRGEYSREKVVGRPHIEGYRGAHKGGPTTKWMVGATFYLTDVEPGGGGTYFWPGSCHSVHRYFQRYPEDIPNGGALNTSVRRRAQAAALARRFFSH